MHVKLNNMIVNMDAYSYCSVVPETKETPPSIGFFRHNGMAFVVNFATIEEAEAEFNQISNMVDAWYN